MKQLTDRRTLSLCVWCFLLMLGVGCGSETSGGSTNNTTNLDGGVLDAAQADDATVDAGQGADSAAADDSATTDIGQTDAGAADAGAADAGAADAGAADAGTTDADVAAPTWATVHAEIIVKNSCAGGYCHGGGAGSLKLTGDAAKDHAALLSGAAGSNNKAMCAKSAYVVPNKPEESLLWLKIDKSASHGCGGKMPPSSGAGGLSKADSDLLKTWIAAGAQL